MRLLLRQVADRNDVKFKMAPLPGGAGGGLK